MLTSSLGAGRGASLGAEEIALGHALALAHLLNTRRRCAFAHSFVSGLDRDGVGSGRGRRHCFEEELQASVHVQHRVKALAGLQLGREAHGGQMREHLSAVETQLREAEQKSGKPDSGGVEAHALGHFPELADKLLDHLLQKEEGHFIVGGPASDELECERGGRGERRDVKIDDF